MAALTTWCDFCFALQHTQDIGHTPEYKRQMKHLPVSREVYQSERFIAIAGLGQITDGYILLLTKEHFFSMAHLPSPSYYEELEFVHNYIVAVLSRLYARPIVFEHGPMPVSAGAGSGVACEGGGSCMDHAHLHFFPIPAQADFMLKRLQEHHSYHRITHLAELQIQQQRNMPYLFFENALQQRWVFDAPAVPSQYLRRLVAEVMNVPDRWNWHQYPEPERLSNTVQRFKSRE
jgi:ATP adenylyltransferase